MANINNQLINIEAEGYALLPKIVVLPVVEQLRNHFDKFYPAGGNIRDLVLDPVVAALAELPSLQAIVEEGLSAAAKPVRLLLFDKTPEKNWPVAWHQDRTIAVNAEAELPGYGPWSTKKEVVHVQPPVSVLESMLTLRVHLDDATAQNGALHVVPGSHQRGYIAEDEISEASSGSVCCEARTGDVLVMFPLILHRSGRSEIPSQRRVLHIEYAHAELPPPLDWHAAAK